MRRISPHDDVGRLYDGALTSYPLISACSMLALMLGTGATAQAQEANLAPTEDQPKTATPALPDDRQIVVIGSRTIIASLKDIEVEQAYDSDRAASYAVSTVGELLDQITAENGDAAPSFLINGHPVSGIDDIADFPVEAIRRIEVLPRGAATRIGGPAGQRAYNLVLKPSIRSATITTSRQIAIEGGWNNTKGEALFTRVKGQDRVNLTLRAGTSDLLLESDRQIIPLAELIPFSVRGNIVPRIGTEVDPVLSALAGQPVSSVALSDGNIQPSLADLLVGANQINPSNLSNFRSLRGATQPYEASIAGNKKFAKWLNLSFNGRLNWNKTTSQSGLPAARFLIPATNRFTPFSNSVLLALNDPARPLQNIGETTSGSISATLNANFGSWRVTVVGRYDNRERTYAIDQIGSIPGGLITVDAATNPFAGTLAGTIPVNTRTTRSKTITRQFSEDAEGPLFKLPAGTVRFRAGIGLAWSSLDASDSTGASDRSFRRREFITKAGITIPLTSRQFQFLPTLGETEVSLDAARLDLGRFGRLDRHSIAFNWNPLGWLRLSASHIQDGRVIPPELLAAPTVVTDNVRFFDPLTGDTIDVTSISGGAANLRNETQRTKSLSVSASPLAKYNLQLNADYLVTDLKDQIGALPPPSTAVVAAFPDRFQRDPLGRLVLVDNRTVNFARQHSRELRTSIGFMIPLSATAKAKPVTRGSPRAMLQANVSHTFLLESKTVIRDGLGTVDLLDGGAIGIGGGRQRHVTDASVALTKGGTGMRMNAVRRGASALRVGSVVAPDQLTFAPLMKIDLKAFADLGALFPKSRMAKGSRLMIGFENLSNDRQRVTNSQGNVPVGFQPGYLDPVGQTLIVELRKVF